MKKLVVFGNGEQAEVAGYLFECGDEYEVIAYTVDKEFNKGEFCNKESVDFETVEQIFPPGEYEMFVAIGYSGMNQLRRDKYEKAKAKGYKLASYISPAAHTFPDFNCGENCLILEMNNIQPFVKIGNNVTLWSGNHIGHHTIIEDDVFMTSHVVVSGGVKIGKGSFLGVNATLRDHIEIGERTLIASGTMITKNTEAEGVYMGVPAKLRSMKSTELKI